MHLKIDERNIHQLIAAETALEGNTITIQGDVSSLMLGELQLNIFIMMTIICQEQTKSQIKLLLHERT